MKYMLYPWNETASDKTDILPLLKSILLSSDSVFEFKAAKFRRMSEDLCFHQESLKLGGK